MNANERYEYLAKQFKRDTELLAPGKDAPSAVAGDPDYDLHHRQREWDKWLETHHICQDCLEDLHQEQMAEEDYELMCLSEQGKAENEATV